MYKPLLSFTFGFTIVVFGALNNPLNDIGTLLKAIYPIISSIQRDLVNFILKIIENSKVVLNDYINQLQFDSDGSYLLYKYFYCSEDVSCPQTLVHVFPTKGHFAIQNIQCQAYGQGLSFDIKFTEIINTFNKRVDPVEQKFYIYSVRSTVWLQFDKISFSNQNEQKYYPKIER